MTDMNDALTLLRLEITLREAQGTGTEDLAEAHDLLRQTALDAGATEDESEWSGPYAEVILTIRRQLREQWEAELAGVAGKKRGRLGQTRLTAATYAAYMLGQLEERAGNREAAFNAYRQGARLGDYDCGYELANFGYDRKDPADRLLDLRAIYEGGLEDQLQSANNLADHEEWAGNREAGKAAHRRMVKLGEKGDVFEPYWYSLHSLAKLEEEDHRWASARRLYKLLLEEGGGDDPDSAYEGLARVELQAGRINEAIIDLLPYCREPSEASASMIAARVAQSQLADLELAVKLYRRAKKSAESTELQEDADLNIAAIYHHWGYSDEAMSLLEPLLSSTRSSMREWAAEVLADWESETDE